MMPFKPIFYKLFEAPLRTGRVYIFCLLCITIQKKKQVLKNSRRARNSTLRPIIYQVELRPDTRCPISGSYYLSHSMTIKTGIRRKEIKRPPATPDKAIHWLNCIWLFTVQRTCAASHPFQNVHGLEGWTVLILQTISKLKLEERQKLNLSQHFLHSKLPLSCDAQMSFSMRGEKKLFSIMKNGFPLPTNIGATASHRSIS